MGRVWTEEELRRTQDICLRHGVILLADEIHNDLIRGGFEHHSVMELFPDADNVICCTAPCKTFNIAGLGVSHMFCRNEEYRKKIKEAVGWGGPGMFASAACMAALTDCDGWLDQLNEYLDGNFSLFYGLCRRYFPKAVPTRTEGTYLAWLDVRAYVGENTKDLESRIYEKCGVYIECGDAFGGKGFLRINLACPRAYIEEAFRRTALLLPREGGCPVSSDPYLEEMYLEAKKSPSVREAFLDRIAAEAVSEADRQKGALSLPADLEKNLRSHFEERLSGTEKYSDFIRFYNTKINTALASAALDSVKG